MPRQKKPDKVTKEISHVAAISPQSLQKEKLSKKGRAETQDSKLGCLYDFPENIH